ncbi:hypothetical protein YC2023_040228 [Brassica napus]
MFLHQQVQVSIPGESDLLNNFNMVQVNSVRRDFRRTAQVMQLGVDPYKRERKVHIVRPRKVGAPTNSGQKKMIDLDVFAGAFAADIGDLELINCLLKAGAEPNQKDEEGNSNKSKSGETVPKKDLEIFKFCDSGIFFEQRLLILNPLILPSSQTKASAGFGLGQAEHALSDAKRNCRCSKEVSWQVQD